MEREAGEGEVGRRDGVAREDPGAGLVLAELAQLKGVDRSEAFLGLQNVTMLQMSTKADLGGVIGEGEVRGLMEYAAFSPDDVVMGITTVWSNLRVFQLLIDNNVRDSSVVELLRGVGFVPFLVGEMEKSGNAEYQRICVLLLSRMVARVPSCREDVMATNLCRLIDGMEDSAVFSLVGDMATKPTYSREIAELGLRILATSMRNGVDIPQAKLKLWKSLLETDPSLMDGLPSDAVEHMSQCLWTSMQAFLHNCLNDLASCYRILALMFRAKPASIAPFVAFGLCEMIGESIFKQPDMFGTDMLRVLQIQRKSQSLKKPHDRILKHGCNLIALLLESDRSFVEKFAWIASDEFLHQLNDDNLFHSKLAFLRAALVFAVNAQPSVGASVLTDRVLQEASEMVQVGIPESEELADRLKAVAAYYARSPEVTEKLHELALELE